jgi:hypothetical protein
MVVYTYQSDILFYIDGSVSVRHTFCIDGSVSVRHTTMHIKSMSD